MFGELPAYGLYLRHAKNITMKNVKLVLDDSDYRPGIVADDVKRLVMEELQPNDVFHHQ